MTPCPQPGGSILPAIVLVASLALSLFQGTVSAVIEYDLLEEVPVGTVVGNVKRDSNLTSQYSSDDADKLRFRLRPGAQGQQKFFALDETTGEVTLAQGLNRENLCPYSLTCDLHFDVSVRPVNFYQVIKVVVHVVDVNDHWPVFPRESITLNIPETAVPGAMFMVPAAEDSDIGLLGVHEYRLVSDHQDLFQLEVVDQFDGAKEVRLKLVSRLDRELVDKYRLTVVAVDGGHPPRSGSIVVNVTVLDSNDHSPQFENSTYEVEIYEDLRSTSTLVRVRATDPDQGLNGEVRYSLSDQTEAVYGRLFDVDEITGDVFLKTSVDFEQHRTFVLTIQATDRGSGSLPVFAKVVVNVLDVNDNAPSIAVNVLTESGIARVEENSAPGAFVAHAAVKDGDSGSNGLIQCFIDDRSLFSLESLYDSEYTITTTVPFDREESSTHELTITCRDKGDPPLTSSRTIQVQVGDVNDNHPELNLPSEHFEVFVRENNLPGASVLKVNATDLDIGLNGDLVYHLRVLGDAPKDTFTVDAQTGNVIAVKELDYERRSIYRLLLNVTDRGVESLSATTTLTVSILDTNDEPPTFDRSFYFLTVRENQPPGTVVGRVNATDRDLSPDYRLVTYDLDVPSGSFDLDEETGELTTLRRLDREDMETHRLAVRASNRGFTGMESRVNVTVTVEDENDSPPAFLFPGGGMDTVELAPHSSVTGAIVTRLVAVDRDSGRNSELLYEINSGNIDDLFHIDPLTGVITLAKRPSTVLNSHPDHHLIEHRLVVAARDRGVPPLLCVADLTIVFNNSLVGASPTLHGPEASFGALLFEGNNVVIVIGAALGFVIIVTCVIVTAVCVRRRRDNRRRKRRKACEEANEISHRHCQSPSFSTRRSHGGFGGSLGSSSAAVESVSAGGGRHVCDCGVVCPSVASVGLMGDEEESTAGTAFIERITTTSCWSGLQQDSGIVANPDGIALSCDSGDAFPRQLTPSSSRCHGVARTRSCSPQACCSHRCSCSHGNRCVGTVPLLSPSSSSMSSNRCQSQHPPLHPYRQQQQQHPSIPSPPQPQHQYSEAVRLLQPSMKMLGHHHHQTDPNGSNPDHDLESLGSASTWTDSGRGPSEEDERLRSGQGQSQGQGSCLNCGSNLAQTCDPISVMS